MLEYWDRPLVSHFPPRKPHRTHNQARRQNDTLVIPKRDWKRLRSVQCGLRFRMLILWIQMSFWNSSSPSLGSTSGNCLWHGTLSGRWLRDVVSFDGHWYVDWALLPLNTYGNSRVRIMLFTPHPINMFQPSTFSADIVCFSPSWGCKCQEMLQR